MYCSVTDGGASSWWPCAGSSSFSCMTHHRTSCPFSAYKRSIYSTCYLFFFFLFTYDCSLFFSLVCNLIFSLCSETIEPKRTRHFEVSYHRPRRLNPMGSLVVESSSLNALTLWMTLVCCQFSFPFPFSHFPCSLI